MFFHHKELRFHGQQLVISDEGEGIGTDELQGKKACCHANHLNK